jgi:hypothetical protein
VDVDFSLRSSRGPRADRWPRSSARGRDGGIREELAAGAEGVNGPAGGSIQNDSGLSQGLAGHFGGGSQTEAC